MKRIKISVDNMRRKSGLARPYFLSVRLSAREVQRYIAMLEWYELDFYDENMSASERFRDLLDKFCDGLQVSEGLTEEELKYVLRRPPNWKP